MGPKPLFCATPGMGVCGPVGTAAANPVAFLWPVGAMPLDEKQGLRTDSMSHSVQNVEAKCMEIVARLFGPNSDVVVGNKVELNNARPFEPHWPDVAVGKKVELNKAEPRGRLVPFLRKCIEHEETPLNIRQQAQELLDKGYCVIRVVDTKVAEMLEKEIWNDLEGLGTGIDRKDPNTWTDEHWPQTTHGLIQNQGSGLWPSTCYARLHTEPIWKALFGGVDVISSFDALAVCKKKTQDYVRKKAERETRNMSEKNPYPMFSTWLHSDQPHEMGEMFNTIQGAFALTDHGPGTLRTQILAPLPGETAQGMRDRFRKAFPEPHGETNANQHPDAHKKWFLQNCRIVLPVVPKGCMLLWASGLPHASHIETHIDNAPTDAGELGTAIRTFVCMIPRELVPREEIVFRRELLEKGVTSCHQVTEVGKRGKPKQALFSLTGRTYGKQLPNFNLSLVQRNFGIYKNLKRGDPRIKEIAPSNIHSGTARICGGYLKRRPE